MSPRQSNTSRSKARGTASADGNDNKAMRLGELLRVLFDNRRIYKRDLPGTLGVSMRTVNRYIANLRSMDIPLVEEETPAGPTLRLQRGADDERIVLALNEFEAVSLNVSLEILRAFEGEFLFDQLQSLREKLELELGRADRKNAEAVREQWVLKRFLPLSFIPPAYPAGGNQQGVFSCVVEALWDETMMAFDYRSRGTTSRKQVHPYTLIFYKGAFYLACLPENTSGLHVYSLARMTNPEVLQEHPSSLPEDYDPLACFDAVSGMLPGQITTVEAAFTPDLREYLNSKKWSDGTTIRKHKGRIHLKTTIHANEELAKWFIGFGDKCEVIAPPAFREQVVDLVRQSMSVYGV